MPDAGVNWMQLDHCIRLLQLGPGLKVLDVSADKSLVGALLTMVGPRGRVWARRPAEESRSAQVEYLEGPGIGLEDAVADRAVGYRALSRWEDPTAELTEVRRVLVRGGRLVLAEGSRGRVEGTGGQLPPPDRLRRMLIAAGYADIRIEDGRDRFFVIASKL